MKPYQYDLLEMRIARIAHYSIELSCLVKILENIIDNDSYNLPESEISTFSGFITKYANRLRKETINLKSDFEFKISR